jgi:hypothetical protein
MGHLDTIPLLRAHMQVTDLGIQDDCMDSSEFRYAFTLEHVRQLSEWSSLQVLCTKLNCIMNGPDLDLTHHPSLVECDWFVAHSPFHCMLQCGLGKELPVLEYDPYTGAVLR